MADSSDDDDDGVTWPGLEDRNTAERFGHFRHLTSIFYETEFGKPRELIKQFMKRNWIADKLTKTHTYVLWNHYRTTKKYHDFALFFIWFHFGIDLMTGMTRRIATDKESKTVVLTFGEGRRAGEILPNFVFQLAMTQRVTLYNFSHKRVDIRELKVDRSRIKLPLIHVRTNFPTDDGEGICRFALADNPEQANEMAIIYNDCIADLVVEYTNVFIAKKREMEDFKLIIYYNASIHFPKYLAQIAQNLINSTLFTLGKDLELVHTFYALGTDTVIRYTDTKVPWDVRVFEQKVRGRDRNMEYYPSMMELPVFVG